jgi:hypothetical protein
MKTFYTLSILVLICTVIGGAQLRDYRIHSRGMLHQTVYNTGELGRQYDGGTAGILKDYPSMELPPNGYQIIDRTIYSGYHNSFGAGLWMSGKRTRTGLQKYMYCGALSDANGNAVTIENIYCIPISIERTENYPVLSDGTINSSYNPNEAEEMIVSKWKTLDTLGVTVTRTSRAWSFPGYDSFIIYEYELENTTPDTIFDGFVAFPYGLCPSMFGMQRKYNRWAEADLRASDQFARYDLKRFMTYQHDRDGKPDSASFDLWSTEGNRGGLNSPQAVGLLTLHYDYDHLAIKGETKLAVTGADTMSWDANKKIKQPFLNRYENGNLYPNKVQLWLDPAQQRKTRPFRRSDSTFFRLVDPDSFWLGRVRPSSDLGNAQPASHGYGFGPYTLPPNQTMRFTVAEVVGYGPGVASDSVYLDLGGGIRYTDAEPFLNPVPSWYARLTYPGLGAGNYIGSNYLQTHSLPWYVTPGVVSIRDVADRAIQMYTGRELIKYDTSQYNPQFAPAIGVYNTIAIPVPSPIFSVENTPAAINKLKWNASVESFTSPRLHAPFKYYEVLHANDPLGPWTVIDSIGKEDARYFDGTEYVLYDSSSTMGTMFYYAIRSVDTLGGKSGLTQIVQHETYRGAVDKLGKVYVVPNPLVVSNGISGESDTRGEVTDRLQFFGLTTHCTIRIFSYSGQLINTISHDADTYGTTWYQISRNNQLLASGVYFFVVEDRDSGTQAHGKFVIIH